MPSVKIGSACSSCFGSWLALAWASMLLGPACAQMLATAVARPAAASTGNGTWSNASSGRDLQSCPVGCNCPGDSHATNGCLTDMYCASCPCYWGCCLGCNGWSPTSRPTTSPPTTRTVTTTTTVPMPTQCATYTVQDDPTRSITYSGGRNVCDGNFNTGTWYRFQISGVDAAIPSSAPPTNVCNTQATGWYTGTMPTHYQTTSGGICYNWLTTCNWGVVTTASVTQCDGYLVYQILSNGGCNIYTRICTMLVVLFDQQMVGLAQSGGQLTKTVAGSGYVVAYGVSSASMGAGQANGFVFQPTDTSLSAVLGLGTAAHIAGWPGMNFIVNVWATSQVRPAYASSGSTSWYETMTVGWTAGDRFNLSVTAQNQVQLSWSGGGVLYTWSQTPSFPLRAMVDIAFGSISSTYWTAVPNLAITTTSTGSSTSTTTSTSRSSSTSTTTSTSSSSTSTTTSSTNTSTTSSTSSSSSTSTTSSTSSSSSTSTATSTSSSTTNTSTTTSTSSTTSSTTSTTTSTSSTSSTSTTTSTSSATNTSTTSSSTSTTSSTTTTTSTTSITTVTSTSETSTTTSSSSTSTSTATTSSSSTSTSTATTSSSSTVTSTETLTSSTTSSGTTTVGEVVLGANQAAVTNSFVVSLDLASPGAVDKLAATVRQVLSKRTGILESFITVVVTILSRRLGVRVGRLLASSLVRVSFSVNLPEGYLGTCGTVSAAVDTQGVVDEVTASLQAQGLSAATLISTNTPTASTACTPGGAGVGTAATQVNAGATSSIVIYAGAGGGGLLILAAGIGFAIWYRRRSERLRLEREFKPTWTTTQTWDNGDEMEVHWRAVDADGNPVFKYADMDHAQCLSIYEIAQRFGYAAPRPVAASSGDEEEIVIDLDNITFNVSPGLEGGEGAPYSASPRSAGSPIGSPIGSPTGSPRRAPSPRGHWRRRRQRNPASLPQTYWTHEFIEYFSLSYQRWCLGWIVGPDCRNESIILYKAIVGPKLDRRRLVPIDVIRRPLKKGEPIYVQGGPNTWVPAVVHKGCPITIDRRRYSIKVEATGKVIHKVPAIHVKPRYPMWSEVYVFISASRGWVKGNVFMEFEGTEERPVPVVRPKYFEASKMPSWTMVLVMFPEAPSWMTEKVMMVPSYTVSRKDYTVGPPPFPVSRLTDGIIPPWTMDPGDYDDDEDETGPSVFDFSHSMEQARRLLQACTAPGLGHELEIVVDPPRRREEATLAI